MKIPYRLLPLVLALAGTGMTVTAHAQSETTQQELQNVYDESAAAQRDRAYIQSAGQHEEQQAAMAEQLQKLKDQLDTLNAQKDAMTGSSGRGAIVTQDFAESVPRDWRETLDAVNNGGKVSELAKSIRDKLEDDMKPSGDAFADGKKNLQAGFDSAVSGQASNAAAYEASTKRIETLKQLQMEIDGTRSAKEIADLQARIQVESSQINNELVRTQSMNGLLQQAEFARAYQSMKRVADETEAEKNEETGQ
jgi:type IV secretion system protein VirB5